MTDEPCSSDLQICSVSTIVTGSNPDEHILAKTRAREENDFGKWQRKAEFGVSEMPSLALLQTVEAVIRLGSFKRAAEELCVTASAISHRVRQVEEHLGRPLFEREGKGVRATKDAVHISDAVAAAHTSINSAWRAAANALDGNQVAVCCIATFAEHFILANHEDFKRKFPHFRVHSTNVTYREGGMRENYDILIGIGAEPSGDWECKKIHSLAVRPIVSTKHAAAAFRDNMLFGPLLDTTNSVMPWPLAAQHLGYAIHPDAKTITFDSLLGACSAASHGIGVAVAPSWVAASYVRTGAVEVIGEAPIPTNSYYWLATKKGRRLNAVHDRFERWLLARVAESDAQPV